MANKKGNSPHSQIFLDLIKAKEKSCIKPYLINNYKQTEIKTNKATGTMQSPALTTSSLSSIAVSDDESEKIVAIRQQRVIDPEKQKERDMRSRLRIFFNIELEGQDMQLCFA
jgi:hypothetical protein